MMVSAMFLVCHAITTLTVQAKTLASATKATIDLFPGKPNMRWAKCFWVDLVKVGADQDTRSRPLQ